ncbi:hypothetical protein KIPB_000815 [Kipferlia bialata]|uniref:Uncharacterized protein n=1 Tax=Kipferlia bialata TaxID=797122 RepID=A0A391NU82_9EUKA|nr:hypothetical protein KIPB_000815 [Kipferlia bialata]|eukprot:g815.t1
MDNGMVHVREVFAETYRHPSTYRAAVGLDPNTLLCLREYGDEDMGLKSNKIVAEVLTRDTSDSTHFEMGDDRHSLVEYDRHFFSYDELMDMPWRSAGTRLLAKVGDRVFVYTESDDGFVVSPCLNPRLETHLHTLDTTTGQWETEQLCPVSGGAEGLPQGETVERGAKPSSRICSMFGLGDTLVLLAEGPRRKEAETTTSRASGRSRGHRRPRHPHPPQRHGTRPLPAYYEVWTLDPASGEYTRLDDAPPWLGAPKWTAVVDDTVYMGVKYMLPLLKSVQVHMLATFSLSRGWKKRILGKDEDVHGLPDSRLLQVCGRTLVFRYGTVLWALDTASTDLQCALVRVMRDGLGANWESCACATLPGGRETVFITDIQERRGGRRGFTMGVVDVDPDLDLGVSAGSSLVWESLKSPTLVLDAVQKWKQEAKRQRQARQAERKAEWEREKKAKMERQAAERERQVAEEAREREKQEAKRLGDEQCRREQEDMLEASKLMRLMSAGCVLFDGCDEDALLAELDREDAERMRGSASE